jgi:hypothetical protein
MKRNLIVQIHLHQGLLHMLDMGGGIFHKPLSLAQIRAQGCYLGISRKLPRNRP